MKSVLFSFILLSLCSCAKLGYLIDQGHGQWQLFSQGKDNHEVLQDDSVKQEHKQKIRLVQKYKAYFYNYYNKEPTEVYEETTFLDREAVTYLVIASKYDEVKAKQECFVFMGCFPYLGFFDEKKATSYQKKLESKGMVTYKRPVLAYSTLGYFDDNILSTFFSYDEEGLAELIFHELFHTIFFIKNEVDLNENLATYFSQRMVEEYFSFSQEEIARRKESRRKVQTINKALVAQVDDLVKMYEEKKPKMKEEAQALFDQFMENRFKPSLQKVCRELKVKNCYPLKREWNNASLTAYLTYQDKMSKLYDYHQSKNMGLRELLKDFEDKYKMYKKNYKGKERFSEVFWEME